jgi:hypothetical protein
MVGLLRNVISAIATNKKGIEKIKNQALSSSMVII